MKIKHVRRYCCEFCGMSRASYRSIESHEVHCFRNPNRVPYIGELTRSPQLGELVDFGYDEAIHGNWMEFVYRDKMPPWWPGVGMIYTEAGWKAVPGWRQEDAKPGHGCAGGAPPVDVWPEFDGKPLDKFAPYDRCGLLWPDTNDTPFCPPPTTPQ